MLFDLNECFLCWKNVFKTTRRESSFLHTSSGASHLSSQVWCSLGRGDLPLFNPRVLPLIGPLAPQTAPSRRAPRSRQRHACPKCEPTRARPNCSHGPLSMPQRSASRDALFVNDARLASRICKQTTLTGGPTLPIWAGQRDQKKRVHI